MEHGIDVDNRTTKALRECLAGEIAKPANGYDPPREGVSRLTGALLVGMSRDLEELTDKVEATRKMVADLYSEAEARWDS